MIFNFIFMGREGGAGGAIDRLKGLFQRGGADEAPEEASSMPSARAGGVMNYARGKIAPLLLAAGVAVPQVACGDIHVSAGAGAGLGVAPVAVDTDGDGNNDTYVLGPGGGAGAGIVVETNNRTTTVGVGGAGAAGVGLVHGAPTTGAAGGAGFDINSQRTDNPGDAQPNSGPADPFGRNR
jgi:hypothetical protein